MGWSLRHQPVDTGWWVLPNPEGVEGQLIICRTGQTVSVQPVAIRGATGTLAFGTLPAGWRPQAAFQQPVSHGLLEVTAGGAINLRSVTSATTWITGAVSYRVPREAPTVMPGVKL